MVNTKLISHEQNKKNMQKQQRQFQNFFAQIFKYFAIFQNFFALFSEKLYSCSYFLEQALTYCNSHLHPASCKTLIQHDEELVRHNTGGNKALMKIERKIKNQLTYYYQITYCNNKYHISNKEITCFICRSLVISLSAANPTCILFFFFFF